MTSKQRLRASFARHMREAINAYREARTWNPYRAQKAREHVHHYGRLKRMMQ